MHPIIDSFVEYQNSRAVNPYNVADAFCLLVGTLEADIIRRMNDASDIPTKMGYQHKLDALNASFNSFQLHAYKNIRAIEGTLS